MSTINDLNISSLSYTAKDFASIYPEILKLATQLTTKWDPTQSNESDPGVVLLKEAAFVADHNNYNIDKNILENFLPSATQDRSVRNITEMNGYTPRYYVSATGTVSLKWTCPEDSKSDSSVNKAFTIPAFTLVVTDSDSTVTYTQIEDLTILGDGQTSGCTFIEGTIQTLSINDSNTITYNNLDDNNRVYLPETMVAQNGIYIKNINSNDWSGFWERDNYLLTRPNGSRIYKIDYDSAKGLPYIEFPSDIANIIGDGLQIQYIATSGTSGNIAAKTLSTITSPASFIANNETATRSCSDFTVTNLSAISNGKDPETINEMYKSFKKIIGTFDTLVSCKDYSNAINNLEDSNFNKMVSNSYVTDRRSDYNKAAQVVTYDEYKELFKIISLENSRLVFQGFGSSLPTSGTDGDLYCLTSVSIPSSALYVYNSGWKQVSGGAINLNDFSQLTSAMTPYDLAIYALTAFSMNDYSASAKGNALNKSFKPVNSLQLKSIKSELEENKCISHTYNDPNSNEIFCFKNYTPINVVIHPFNKVTKIERNEIIDNVWRALSENFNAAELEFGSELDYDSVRKVIINSDSRINTVVLEPFTYSLKAMLGDTDGTELDPYTANLPTSSGNYKIIVDMAAKNVLAGRVCLFNLDDDFSYKYGQVIKDQGGIYRNVKKISTELTLPLDTTQITTITTETVNTEHTFVTGTDLTGYDWQATYYFDAPNKNSTSDRQPIPYNNEYTLKGNDVFFFSYVDKQTKKTVTATYKSHDNLEYTIKNLSMSSIINVSGTETKSISTSGTIVVTETATYKKGLDNVTNLNNYTLNKNEIFQVINPNYYSTTSYGAYVNYRYEGSSNIQANTEHVLGSDERIILLYSDSSSGTSIQQTAILSPGDTVKANFTVAPTNAAGTVYTSGTTKTWTDLSGQTHTGIFQSLSSSQTIDKREILKTILDSQLVMCYWIIESSSDGSNRVFETGQTEKILESGDYFIYANSTLDEMVILGSGTKLTRTDTNDKQWLISNDPLAIDVISEQGKDAILDWQTMDFSANNLEIQEMAIITLGEGDTIRLSGWEDAPEALTNTWTTCAGTITYTAGGTTTSLPKVSNFYQVRTRLDLSMSNDSYQELGKNQTITLSHDGGETTLSKEGLRIQASSALTLVGGKDLNMQSIYDLGLYLNMYAYDVENITQTIGTSTENISPGDSGYVINLDKQSGHVNLPFYVQPIYSEGDSIKKRLYLLPVYIYGTELPVTAQVTKNGSPINIREFNSGNSLSNSLSFVGTNMFYIEIPIDTFSTGTQLELVLSWNISEPLSESETIIINEFFTIISTDGNILNTELAKCSGVDSDSVCGRIREIIANSDHPSIRPYYTYIPDNSMLLEKQDLSDATALWDINNVANKMTIPQIDYKNSNVDIATSLRGY